MCRLAVATALTMECELYGSVPRAVRRNRAGASACGVELLAAISRWDVLGCELQHLVVKRRVELQRNICAEVVVESSRSALPVHLPQPAMQHGRLTRTRCSRARAPAFESNPSLVAGVAEPHRTHR